MTRQLLLHPKPFMEESVFGYCLRLSRVNGLQSLRGLHHYAARQALSPSLSEITGHDAQLLSTLRGPAPAWQAKQQEWEQGLTATFWQRSHRRWCPLCLREQAYWRANWSLTLVTACNAHGLLLLDRCSSCGRHVLWSSGDLTHCQCGQDLRFTQGLPATQPALDSAHYLALALKRSLDNGSVENHASAPHTSAPIADLQLGQLCSLLWFFGAYLFHADAVKPQKIPHHGEIRVVLPLVSMAMSILDDWPTGFHSFLDRFSKGAQGCTAALHIHLGVLHQALFRLLKHPEMHFLQEAFERYVHERWGGALLYAGKLKHEHPLMSGTEAAKTLGISMQRLKMLIAEGELQGSFLTTTKGRKQLIVDRTSVQMLKRHKGAEIPLIEATKILRISPPRIRLLVQHRLLRPAHPDKGHTTKYLPFYGKDINAFLASLSHDECHHYAESTDLISVWRIGKQWLRGDENFLRLITALMRGELNVTGRDPGQSGVRALLLHRSEFRCWFDQLHVEQELMSIPDAAKFLHIDDTTFYCFVQAGLLPLDDHRLYCFGRHIPGIRRATLVELKEKYLWGKELAQLTGHDLTHAAAAVMHRGAEPVAGPWINKSCCYVFRREDVSELLPVSEVV
ncbi:TniQ family protein [Pseudogulbenkiania subflava]|uniref:TniQ protein n=1 Tax=Pseudogulbenkiania subflava DSM 22618 TaxID=1123014 RepID=A0A1Y6BL95_9NEIS|nr:TniQ family protein [Pseudogulbenkiania subflava]SMF08469.1 TniQ protein [Pseudogulbenkiania subflava DSM 22618]